MSDFLDLTDEELRLIMTWREVQRMHVKAGPMEKPTYEEMIAEGWEDAETRDYLDGFEERTRAEWEKAKLWCSTLDKLLAPAERLLAAVFADASVGEPTPATGEPQ